MSNPTQKLGIEIELSLSGKFESIIKQIEDRFAKLNVEGAIKQVEKMEAAMKKAATGLDFSKLNNAQWKLIEDGAKNYGVSITKASQNVADLNKNLADTVNHQRKWEAGVAEVNGKMIPATKALADQIVNTQKETSKAHVTRMAELTEEQRKLREIEIAYSQKASQDGVAPRQIARTTDLAYGQRALEISQEDKLANLKSRLIEGRMKKEAEEVNRLSRLRSKEELIEAKSDADAFWRVIVDRNREGANRLKQTLKEISKESSDVQKKLFEDQQKDWNRSAGTVGAKYKANPYGEGFIRASVDTTYVDALRQANKAHEEFSTTSKKASASGTLFGESIGKVVRHLIEFYAVRKILFTMSSEFSSAVSELIKFNQGLADTAAIANASTEATMRFGNAAKSIAKNTKLTLEDTMKMMNLLAQSGVDAKDVPSVSKVTAMFAAGTGSSPENAVRVMTTAMNVWKISADDSAKAANILAAGLNASKLEVQDLSTVFNYLAPVAKQVGMSLEETTGAISTLSQAGVKASTIGTSVAELLNKLMAPTPKLLNLFKDYGIRVDEVNPRLHTMADVIERIGKANIPLEHLYSSLGPRAGRSLEGFLTLGPEYLRAMTDNVTGTQAAITAYLRVMEGAGAKLNVLKQTFIQSIGSIGQSWSGTFDVMYQGAKDLAEGIGTAGGKIAISLGIIGTALALLAANISGIGTAWAFVKKINPEIAIMTAAITAVAIAVGYFGRESNNSFAAADAKIKEYGKSMSDTQRAFTTVSDMYKTASAEGIKHNLVKDSEKEILIQLSKTYPTLFNNLDVAKLKYEDLTTAMKNLNAQRVKNMFDMAPEYNELANRKEAVESKYSGRINEQRKRISQADDAIANPEKYAHKFADGSVTSAPGIIERYKKQRDDAYIEMNRLESEKDKELGNVDQRMEAIGPKSAWFKGKDSQGNVRWTPKLVESEDLREGNTQPPPRPTKEEMRHQMLAEQLAEKVDKQTGEKIAAHKISLAKLEVEMAKLDSEEAKLELKDDKDLLKYKADAQENLLKEYYLMYNEMVMEENKRAASDVSGKLRFDEDGNLISIIAGKGFDQKDVDNAVARAQERIAKGREKLNSWATKEGTKIDQTTVKDDRLKLNSEFLEKQINRRIQLENQDYALRKELSKSADESRSIDIDHNQRLLEMEQDKKAAFEEDIRKAQEFLATTKETGVALQVHIDRYEETKQKLEDVDRLIRDYKRTIADQSNSGFFYNFTKGATEAMKSMGDFKSMTQDLGKTLTTTLETGLETTLNKTIDMVESMKWSWRDLGKTIGNVLKDVANELQHYMVRLFAVWVMQQVVGLMTSSSGSQTAFQANSPALSQGAPMNFGNELGLSGVLQRADGGLVPLDMGTPGRDSVRALLTPGEFVVREDSVRRYGLEKLKAINEQRFAQGGFVGTPSASSSTENSSANLTIVNVADPTSIPPSQPNETQIVNIVSFALQKNATFRQQIKAIAQG